MQYINADNWQLIPSRDAAAWYFFLVSGYDEVVHNTVKNKAELNDDFKYTFILNEDLTDKNRWILRYDYFLQSKIMKYKQNINLYNKLLRRAKEEEFYFEDISDYYMHKYGYIYKSEEKYKWIKRFKYWRQAYKGERNKHHIEMLFCAGCRKGKKSINEDGTITVMSCKNCVRLMCSDCATYKTNCFFCNYEKKNKNALKDLNKLYKYIE